jgi:serine/threonine-protein kinase
MDVGALEDGSAYMALELLDGKDLGAVVEERGALPVDEAVDYALQALEGVAHAHALGIVHRDLKPANLFLTKGLGGEPMVKVLDFGIAKATLPDAARASVTQTSALLGSPAFMSPEQVRSSRDVDTRTDIWSMGVILYRLLSAQAPFGGDHIGAMFAAILEEVPASLHELRPEVPEGLSAVVARCLEKKREARWQSAGELADALTPYTYPAGSVTAERIKRALGTTDAPVSRVASVSPEALASLASKKASPMRARAMSVAPEMTRAAEGTLPSERSTEGERTTSPWIETTASLARGRTWMYALAAVALVGIGVGSVMLMRGGARASVQSEPQAQAQTHAQAQAQAQALALAPAPAQARPQEQPGGKPAVSAESAATGSAPPPRPAASGPQKPSTSASAAPAPPPDMPQSRF